MSTPTRDRILTSTTDLFRRQGYSATGIKQIVEHAGAAFGSIYHFFPGGKEQLGAEVIRTAGSSYGDLIDLVYGADPDAVRATRTFFREAARTMVAEDFADICPIATVALEVASTSEPLREATAAVFDQWRDRVAAHLIRAGLARRAARRLAVSLIALVEGSFLLARAGRSTETLEINAGVAAGLVQAALDRRGTRAGPAPSVNA